MRGSDPPFAVWIEQVEAAAEIEIPAHDIAHLSGLRRGSTAQHRDRRQRQCVLFLRGTDNRALQLPAWVGCLRVRVGNARPDQSDRGKQQACREFQVFVHQGSAGSNSNTNSASMLFRLMLGGKAGSRPTLRKSRCTD